MILGVHGGLGSAISLLPVAEHLADDFEVVLINLRGHGTSGWGHSTPHISHMIDDVLAVIDAVGPVTTLFGYPYGAVIALETALVAPDRIDRLTLYEPPLPITYPIPAITGLENRLTAGDYEQLLLDTTPAAGGFTATELAALRTDPLWMSKVAHVPTLVPTMQILAGLAPTVEQYAAVTVPTRLIVGTTSAPYILAAADLSAAAGSPSPTTDTPSPPTPTPAPHSTHPASSPPPAVSLPRTSPPSPARTASPENSCTPADTAHHTTTRDRM